VTCSWVPCAVSAVARISRLRRRARALLLPRVRVTGWVVAFCLLPLLEAEAVAGAAAHVSDKDTGWSAKAAPDSTLLVLAASSLAEVLPRLANAWRQAGGVEVRFSFDATSRLAVQVLQSPSADAFFAADLEWMNWLEERAAMLEGAAKSIAANELVVVVPAGANPPAIPADLALFPRIALAGENVPAGRYARAALEATGVWAEVADKVVRGGSVRGALEWVARGEVPVGIVYRTDAAAEPGVRVAFAFDASSHPPVLYWAAPLSGTDAPESTNSFLLFVVSEEARAIFGASGFAEVVPASAQDLTAGALNQPPAVASAIRLSLIVALLATLAGLVPAVGLGWVLARREFPGKALLSTLVMAPLVMPPVVTGFLLLSVLGGGTPLGSWLASLGLPVPFTILGAAIAAFVVGLPLYVISIRGAFEAVDPMYEELSWTLGVPPSRTFFRVSLPLALPGIVAGAVLAFARALGEFGATVVLAGNVEGSTRTIALAVYTLLESPSGRSTIWLLVGASVAISMLALLGFETLSRRQKMRLDDRHGH
jgi:molybdate transport system permease protein